MSVIAPEFFNFIKKLEDNGDKLTPTTPVEQPLEFEFNVRAYLYFTIVKRVRKQEIYKYPGFFAEFELLYLQWILRP